MRSRSARRNASVAPSPNSETPAKGATRALGAKPVAIPSASNRPAHAGRVRAVEARHQTGVGVGQLCRDLAEIAARNLDVGVVDDHNGIARRAGQIDQRSGFAIWRQGSAHDDANTRIGGSEVQVFILTHAEKQLEFRILLLQMRADRDVQAGRRAADWFQHRNSRRRSRVSRFLAPQMPQTRRDRDSLIGARDAADGAQQPSHGGV